MDAAIATRTPPATHPDAAGDGARPDVDGSETLPPNEAGIDDDANTQNPQPDVIEQCAPTIRDFDRVALWLSASKGLEVDDEARVERWDDASLHRHEALPVGAPTLWPRIVTIDERVGVQFGTASTETTEDVRRLRVADHAALQFATKDYALIAVLRYRNSLNWAPHTTGAIFLKMCDCESNYRGVGLFANDTWGHYTDGSRTRSAFTTQLSFEPPAFARTDEVGLNDNQIHIVVARRLGTSLSIAVDQGAASVPFVIPELDVDERGADVVIGANFAGPAQALHGELFELLAITGEEAQSVDALVACLATTYAIP
jgi:hypothetical protein